MTPGVDSRVLLRCYAEFNDYLPASSRQQDLTVGISDGETVADVVADLGLPAGDVELVLVNGVSVRLDQVLRDRDRISLYPVFESLDVSPVQRLRDRPLRRVRFVADAHLGRLARYLRLLGFDTRYENDPGDPELARISAEEGRVLLTRDRALLARKIVTRGLMVPSGRPRDQLVHVVDRLDLYRLFVPFSRCSVCNAMLATASREDVAAEVPPRVGDAFARFWRCGGCGRVYWRGSHYERLRAFVRQIEAGGKDGASR